MLLSDRFFFNAIRGASGRACLGMDSFGHPSRSGLAPFEIVG